MTKEETKRRAEIMLAAEYDGSICINIEGKTRNSREWHKISVVIWNWDDYDYRVIPKPMIMYVKVFDDGYSVSDSNLDNLKPFSSNTTNVLKITIGDGKPSAEFIDMESEK